MDATVTVQTDHPIAEDSPDHVQPWGTARDNSRNRRFNSRLYGLYDQPSVLDLGCAGGGFVRDCLDDGLLAVGIEGSDYSKKRGRAEWAELADSHLFTADITKRFQVQVHGKPASFDVITAWEVLEHLTPEGLGGLYENIHRHLGPGGAAIFSISSAAEVIDGVSLHQTVQGPEWWETQMTRHGFTPLPALIRYFNGQYIRDALNAPSSFQLAVSATPEQVPVVPRLTLMQRAGDGWRWFAPRARWKLRHRLPQLHST